jgi:hypothetical protein
MDSASAVRVVVAVPTRADRMVDRVSQPTYRTIGITGVRLKRYDQSRWRSGCAIVACRAASPAPICRSASRSRSRTGVRVDVPLVVVGRVRLDCSLTVLNFARRKLAELRRHYVAWAARVSFSIPQVDDVDEIACLAVRTWTILAHDASDGGAGSQS